MVVEAAVPVLSAVGLRAGPVVDVELGFEVGAVGVPLATAEEYGGGVSRV